MGARPSTHTGAWASRRPHSRELRPLCSDACPAGNDVRGFVQAAAAGDDDAGAGVLLETSPFPGICGRVCPAPCMDACNRRELDGAVDVRDIERALGRPRRLAAPQRSVRAARRGGGRLGPAGLSAAYHLARLGHRGDRSARPRPSSAACCAPASRSTGCRAPCWSAEIAFILGHGVEVTHRAPRRPRRASAAGARARRRARGDRAAEPARPRLPGATAVVVEQGLDFLRGACRRRGPGGAAVVVAGGGNTAVDAARTAVRLGARDVRVVYRRTRAEMPAIAEEVDEALEEGVVIDELLSPAGLGERDGRASWCAGGWRSVSRTRAGGRVRGRRGRRGAGRGGVRSPAAGARSGRRPLLFPPAAELVGGPLCPCDGAPAPSTSAAISPPARAPWRRPSAAAGARRCHPRRAHAAQATAGRAHVARAAGVARAPDDRPSSRRSPGSPGSASRRWPRPAPPRASRRCAAGSRRGPATTPLQGGGRALLLLRRLHGLRPLRHLLSGGRAAARRGPPARGRLRLLQGLRAVRRRLPARRPVHRSGLSGARDATRARHREPGRGGHAGGRRRGQPRRPRLLQRRVPHHAADRDHGDA